MTNIRKTILSTVIGGFVVTGLTLGASNPAHAGAQAFANVNVVNAQFTDTNGTQLVQNVDVQVTSLNNTTTNAAIHSILGNDLQSVAITNPANLGVESDALQACVGNCPGENDFDISNIDTDGPVARGDSIFTGNTPTTASVIDLQVNGTGPGNEDVVNASTVAEAILTETSNANASGTIQSNNQVVAIFMGSGTRDVLFSGIADFLVYAELHPGVTSGNSQANVSVNLLITNNNTGAIVFFANILAAQAATSTPGDVDSTAGGPAPFSIPITVPTGVPLNVAITQSSTISVDVEKGVQVPEPATLGLIGTGLILLAGTVRRNRRKHKLAA